MNQKCKRLIILTLCPLALLAQTIEEKMDLLSSEEKSTTDQPYSLKELNQEIAMIRQDLEERFEQASHLLEEGSDQEAFKSLLQDINQLKKELHNQEGSWKQRAQADSRRANEGYALWDLEESTLGQIIMEFGSCDYLYVFSPEMANMKVHLHSNLLIPKESWSSLLEVILQQNGIGYKQINPFTRQLYQLKQDLTAVELITSEEKSLELLAPNSRVIFVFAPVIENLKPAFYFFERFRDPKLTFVYQVGQKIAVVGTKEEVKKLLTLYKNVWQSSNDKITRVVSFTKIHFDDVTKLLKAYFGPLNDPSRPPLVSKGGSDLSVLPFQQDGSCVLVGPQDQVMRAEVLIKETECQVENPQEMTVYWYSCRHSDPLDLAEVLDKVYHSLISARIEGGSGKSCEVSTEVNVDIAEANPLDGLGIGVSDMPDGKPLTPMPANAGLISSQMKKSKSTNFIPYRKTGSILMVVRRDVLDKIKEVVKKLDVPKKMVEIEVLLCERRITNKNRAGLNILKVGSSATGNSRGGADYDASIKAPIKGLFEFFFSQSKHKDFPAFDVAYNFLLSQDDVRVTASPSLITINQTPATIAITDEISINNGAAPMDSNKGIVFEKSYSRAQYGITLVMTPTIHDPELDDPEGKICVTLENNVTFDTIKSDRDDRPDVHKRHIENQVRILDGQTVVIGGLKRKSSDDRSEKIPFLGEVPGFGKIFGTEELVSETTEMFIFITPHVIKDPKEDLAYRREQMLMKRPGDIPAFLEKLQVARKAEKNRFFEQSFELFYGRDTYF
ncbi:MAG: type II secretion system protein GspD [Chlamydiae bacterium]|nr:type II secretion system protein GspD [Chlamydiota bacterium]